MGRKHNVIVVGNGLFGSIAATLCREFGHTVTVVSDEQPRAGSLASGCVLAPSWLNSMERPQIDSAIDVLKELYTVLPMEFKTNLGKTFKASRVDPKTILVKPDIVGRVQSAIGGRVLMEDGTKLPVGKVLVAAGAWCNGIVSGLPPVRGLWGASMLVKGHQLEDPRIHVYAPYRQAVAFNMDKKTVWMGDGTALVQSTWQAQEENRLFQTAWRAHDLFGLPAPNTPEGTKAFRSQVGVRPYIEGHKAGYFANVEPNVWVSTGGAKNGTVLAAWQAFRFVKEALK